MKKTRHRAQLKPERSGLYGSESPSYTWTVYDRFGPFLDSL